MKTLVITLALSFAIPFGLTAPSFAQSGCEGAARRAAASAGGEVLRVRARGNRCVVTLLVRRGNGPPRRIKVVVPRS